MAAQLLRSILSSAYTRNLKRKKIQQLNCREHAFEEESSFELRAEKKWYGKALYACEHWSMKKKKPSR